MGNNFNLSPLDGRYKDKVQALADFFSEAALIKYRIKVEAFWLLKLCHTEAIKSYIKPTPVQLEILKHLAILSDASEISDAVKRVKEIEKITNHDVKAIEYFLREKLSPKGAKENILSFIHFALTSEDVNNLAYAMMLRDAHLTVMEPEISKILHKLSESVEKYARVPMLSRTHGQAASPTTLGKELGVFLYRLARKMRQLKQVPFAGKCNGAVGNFNAHYVSFPSINWELLSREFIEHDLKLTMNPLTTQIENHDHLIEYFDALAGFNTILLSFCRDIWAYVSIGYFKQKPIPGEIGSSTMPHKVNPIDFENAEGNLGLANTLCRHFGEKLAISRWQRDLSDSTVLRSVGVALGYSLLAYKSCLKGMGKLEMCPEALSKDLDDNPEVLAEAVQTVLRKYGVTDAYERLKDLTRGQKATRESLLSLVETTPEISPEDKARLKDLCTEKYIGIATELAQNSLEELKKLLDF